MTIWDEMQDEMVEVAEFMTDTQSVIEELQLGIALMTITCATGVQATRVILLKIAALAAVGIELADVEMEADNV